MTTVIKINPNNITGYTLYIGREMPGLNLVRSKWANPYHLRGNRSRSDSLTEYEQHIRDTPALWLALHEIDNQILGCWCHNSDGSTIWCHGDVLIKLRKEQIDARPNFPRRRR
jgi:hypothetical protein